MQKKPYTPPTLTDHGSVVEETRGLVGWTWESMGRRLAEEDTRPPGGGYVELPTR